MRIIAGEKRGMVLFEPKDARIRPTSDKVKGAIFNTIQWDLNEESVFVDLFGGSGAMSVEALSRGAKKAYIFDIDKESIALIKKNVKKSGCEERAIVVQTDALSAVERLSNQGIECDFVFMDPPYINGNDTIALISRISEKKIMNDDGVIIIEHEKSVNIPSVIDRFVKTKEKKYGITMISYYKQEAADEKSGLSGEF